jgi:hypothetical protein
MFSPSQATPTATGTFSYTVTTPVLTHAGNRNDHGLKYSTLTLSPQRRQQLRKQNSKFSHYKYYIQHRVCYGNRQPVCQRELQNLPGGTNGSRLIIWYNRTTKKTNLYGYHINRRLCGVQTAGRNHNIRKWSHYNLYTPAGTNAQSVSVSNSYN